MKASAPPQPTPTSYKKTNSDRDIDIPIRFLANTSALRKRSARMIVLQEFLNNFLLAANLS
jgi:hypothetical protein